MPKNKDERINRIRQLRRKNLRIARRARKRGATKVANRHYQRAKFWLVKLRHRREWLKNQGEFQTWMLNGHPGNVENEVKRVIVRAVAAGLVVTSTTDGTSHVPNSYHYVRNNPKKDGKGRAADVAGSQAKMRAFTSQEFGRKGSYHQFFGPPNTQYVIEGVVYNGAIAGHYDHNHCAPKATYR